MEMRNLSLSAVGTFGRIVHEIFPLSLTHSLSRSKRRLAASLWRISRERERERGFISRGARAQADKNIFTMRPRNMEFDARPAPQRERESLFHVTRTDHSPNKIYGTRGGNAQRLSAGPFSCASGRRYMAKHLCHYIIFAYIYIPTPPSHIREGERQILFLYNSKCRAWFRWRMIHDFQPHSQAHCCCAARYYICKSLSYYKCLIL